MKVTPEVVRMFEDDQQGYGTKLAISNLLWQVASAVYRDIDITAIKTTYAKTTRVSKKNKRPVVAKQRPRRGQTNILN